MTRVSLSVLVLLATAPVLAQQAGRPGANTQLHEVSVGGVNRRYYLHAAPDLPRDRPLPLVLMIHGGGGTPAFAERESKFSPLSDREKFLVAYPEGIGKGWNDGRGSQVIPAQRDNVDDIAFISALIDDVGRTYQVDPARVYSTGISNGAIFSHTLAAKLSSRIAAIAPVVGGLAEPLSEKFTPDHPVSVLILQGSDDPLVPYEGGPIRVPGAGGRGRIVSTDEAVKKWVAANGCQSPPAEEDLPESAPRDGCHPRKYTYSGGKGGSEVILVRIEGGGHTWPGGLQYLPEKIVGRVCRDLDGAQFIWEFFKSHPKSTGP